MLRAVFGKCQTVFRQTVMGPRKTCKYSSKVLPRAIIGITTGVASYYSLKKFKTFNLEEFLEKHLLDPKLFGEVTLDYEHEIQQQRLFQYLSDKLLVFLFDRIFDLKPLEDEDKKPIYGPILKPLFQWQYAWQMIKAVAVVVEQTSPAVVRIFCNGVGTGFFVDKEGLILTVSHGVKDKKIVTVITADDKVYHGDVLSCDTELDLAVIQIQGATKEFTALKLGDSDKIRIKDSVIAIGSPAGIKRGVMSGTAIPTTTDGGSPIINQNGEAIGVLKESTYTSWYNNWTGKPMGRPFSFTFATLSNDAKKFLTEIKNQEK